MLRIGTVLVALMLVGITVGHAEDEKELAKKLANPIANLVSIPVQANYDENIGPDEDGSMWRINIQPVIPFTLNDDWNVITRTIVPIVSQEDVVPGSGNDTGLGDITASQFFSPKDPTANGWIWGVGPVWLLPTASEDALGSEKWGLGPTAVALKQKNGWTYGALVNHIWSYAGDDDRPDVNATFIQPFLAHTLPTATTFTLNTESTYDWQSDEWAVPVNALVSQMLKIGKLPIQVAVGVRYWAESSTNGPEGTGFRLQLTGLLPK